MDSGLGVNTPLAVLAFLAGGAASMGGILVSLLVAVLVPVLGKAVDSFIKTYVAERNNQWRREAARWKEKAEALERASAK